MKILHIIGARPHFMKLAPVYEAIQKRSIDYQFKKDVQIQQVIVHSGQHYDYQMSDQFLEEFNLPKPNYNLDIRSWSQVSQLGRIMLSLEKVLNDEQPTVVLVYGDTNTTSAGALAAAKMNIPLAHVEAGLREFDMRIPEEVNKRIIDAVSDIYFCPTETAIENLANEGKLENVILTGDVVASFIHSHPEKIEEAQARMDLPEGVKGRNYYLVTCHRANNTDNRINLEKILNGLVNLDAPVIFPIHPRTQKSIEAFDLSSTLEDSKVHLIEPQGFWEMQALIENAKSVITDSGGVIRESYIHQKPCIVIDNQTEWIEAVNAGWAQVVGPDAEKIVDTTLNFVTPKKHLPLFYKADGLNLLVDKILSYEF